MRKANERGGEKTTEKAVKVALKGRVGCGHKSITSVEPEE